MSDDIVDAPGTAAASSAREGSLRARNRDKADTVMQTRISQRNRDLIDDAAARKGVSRSTYVIETLVEQSEKILLETLLFQLDERNSEALADIFDNPPIPTEALRELMASKAPWE